MSTLFSLAPSRVRAAQTDISHIGYREFCLIEVGASQICTSEVDIPKTHGMQIEPDTYWPAPQN